LGYFCYYSYVIFEIKVNTQRVLGFGIAVVILGAFIATAMQFAPALMQLPRVQAAFAILGVALGTAVVFYLGHMLVEILLRDDSKPTYDPVKVARDFSTRIIGLLDAKELSAATSNFVEEMLKVHRSGWLLLTPEETTFIIRLVPGKGNLPEGPTELSRNNPLLRQLDLQRRPILQSNVDTDSKYSQMTAAEREWLKSLGVAVYVPAFEAGLLSAVLVVGPKDKNVPFHPADLELLTILATQASAAFKTANVISDLKKLNESITQLNQSLQETNEALEKTNAARSDFLAIASHELRTPITQMLGFADLLGAMAQDNSLDTSMVSEITDNIVRACGRLNEVIGQMLDMAQLDVNAMDLNYDETTIDSILRQAIEPLALALRERKLTLSVKGIRNLPTLRADESRMVQAFSQIVGNAIKFTPDGGRIDIGARLIPPRDGQPEQIEVVVADSGVGIDPKYQALIFDKFYRVGSAALHSTSTTKFMGGGPGLGLPIAKGVIERHGGKIWVESPGHDPEKFPGSRFHIILPVKPPAFDPRALAGPAQSKKEVTIVPGKSPFVGLE
jgi:signal transduction histidine kinase